MQTLITILNKFNGNICFVGATDSVDYIFECDLISKSLVYDSASKSISDVCLRNEASYYVALSDKWLGLFTGGVLIENYIDTGLGNVDKIVSNTSGDIYILDKNLNILYKYDVFTGVIWSFSLPDYSLRNDGNILLRESDGMIIYNNNTSIYLIRDDTTNAILFNNISISGNNTLKVVIDNEFNSSCVYIRARMVTAKELDQSSFSSSSSSSSSLSSDSSMSSSSSSVSSSSSTSYIENWSSSSTSSSSSYIENWSSSSSSYIQRWSSSTSSSSSP